MVSHCLLLFSCFIRLLEALEKTLRGLEAPEERAGTSRRTGTDLEKTTAESKGQERQDRQEESCWQNESKKIGQMISNISKRSEIEVLLALPRLPSSRHIFGLPLSTKVLTVSGVAFRLMAETTYKLK